ncbi:restriction endonuclease subunit S [Denitromonas sp.]|uniref:restriction endonuclease subunit S n=1 Tax=Denitromonas sp. TaxID=2734609 RepID=UPI002AFE76A9|nr:restriction endonuclease subunit S [Denitromonas sp.]
MAKEGKTAVMPRLRFPDFQDAPGWETAPLEEIAERITTKNADGKVTRVLTNSAEYGILDQHDYFDREIATAGKVDSYYIVDAGDYVYNPRTSAIAPVGPISRNNIGKGVMSPLYTVFRFAAEKTDFYEHFFRSAGWHAYVRNAASTGARHDRMSITTSAFMQMPVPIPDESEQQKIADCLGSLDGLIAAQGRKVEALKTYKRGLMQQLFPREGETRPRLRFPEFRDAPEWEETDLALLGELVSGLTYSPDDVRESGLLVLRSSNVQNAEIVLEDNVYVTPNIKGANLVEPNDILICVRNGSKALIGKSALIPEGMPLCTHGAFMTVFRARAPQFVFQLMQSASFHKQVAADLGATINSINGGQLLKYRFVVPEPPEQQRIAEFLSSLDAQIGSEAGKLAALKIHKSGLMQQLFPSLEDV